MSSQNRGSKATAVAIAGGSLAPYTLADERFLPFPAEPRRDGPLIRRYSGTPASGEAFNLLSSSSTCCQALGSFLVA
jgi:hypothetical protein